MSRRLTFAFALLALAAGAPALAAPARKAAPAEGEVTRAQIQAQVKQVFDLADTDKDGFMSPAEFRVRMGAVLNRTPPGTPGAPTKGDAQKMLAAAEAAFKAADSNGDGKLSRTESGRRPLAAFDAMDANGDGVLTAAEKRAAAQASAAAMPAAAPSKGSGAKLDAGR